MALASLIDTVISVYDTIVKKPMSSFCFLETADNMGNLVGADGSMGSIIRIDGARHLMGDEELSHIIDEMSIRLASYLDEPGHAIQVWFARDPDLSRELLVELNQPARAVARSLNLHNIGDLLDERVNHLSRYVVWEGFYMALWTRPAVLSKQELENLGKAMKVPPMWPVTIDSQAVWTASRQIQIRHQAFVNSVLADLERIAIRAAKLDSKDALRAVKASIYPDMVGSEWTPFLPGNKVAVRGQEVGGTDVSHFFVPRLEDQILDKESEVLNPRIVRIGRYNFAALEMSIGPQEVRPFSHLLDRMRKMGGGEFPWRVSFLIEGGGLTGGLQLQSLMAGILGLTSSENRMIRESIKTLQELKQHDETIVKLRVSFCTWGPSNDINLIEERSSQLQRAIETWGYCGVTSNSGDPLAGVLSSALSLNVGSTAPSGAPPLQEVIKMLPWNRDASPWKEGSVLFRTPDGRPWPFQPGSSLQDTYIDLVSAPPGKGKSVFMNSTNLALCLSKKATTGSGGAQLPLISIIDIGHSSSGLISLIKEALPPERRHEAQHRRLRMIKEHAINPFDTQLGCRHPLPLERAFLVNFLTILGTPVGETKAPSGLSDLAGMVIDEVYTYYDDKSRKGQPKLYSPGEDDAVDELLARYNIVPEEEASWWSVVDALFDVGDIHGATLAQRYAVPLISDLTGIIHTDEVKDVHGEAMTANGENLIKVFQRMISSSLREYPILTVPTRFDIGDSRVVALDLDEAAPQGGGPSDKQTALVYMLARFALARDYYLNEDITRLFPERYRGHHAARIRRIREVPKRIVYDEFHRTKASPMIRDQVLIDMREGRKWGVHIALISQLLDDFDKDMVDMATGIWIMGVGNPRAANIARDIFGLSSTATRILNRELNGPQEGGAPFLAVLQLKDGKHEHLLVNTLGPMEMWAFSTTAEDAAIRNQLYSRIGPEETRKRLARRYPNGTAIHDIETRIARMTEIEGAETDAKDGIISQIVEEIINMK